MKTYHVIAQREGDSWTASVTNAEGAHTWGRGLRHLRQSVREAVALAEDIVDEDTIELEWEYVTGDRELDKDAQRLREEREQIATATSGLVEATNALARRLRERGYSVRDAATIAGISPARVDQIVRAT
ncbi:MAG: hypothetical protein U0904_00375 [Candidatus Nanopelagicales bacterium]|nr:hypothetical protein [Candidatus Nanopelagicales bacterium]